MLNSNFYMPDFLIIYFKIASTQQHVFPHESGGYHFYRLSVICFVNFLGFSAKSEGKIGLLSRKWLEMNRTSIHYIGKESNELENSEVLGVFKEDTIEYVNFQKRLREIIENLTLEKALEIEVSRREFYYLKKKLKKDTSIKLKQKLLKKLIIFS